MKKPISPHPTQCALYPTLVTPFDDSLQIDYESLDRLIAHMARHDVDGIFAVCQSSEMFHLSAEERLALAAHSIRACRKYGIGCVVSGHVDDDLQDQIAYLQALEALAPDAIILVSNRLAAADEPDDIAVRHLAEITGALSPETMLGMYECPSPYKRPLTPPLIDAMLRDSRFRFIKDTSCDMDTIRARLALLSGSEIELYNANMATLYDSLAEGASGYSGVMLNFLPAHFQLLKQSLAPQAFFPERAKALAASLTAASIAECQGYPTNAKYCLTRQGVIRSMATRCSPPLSTSRQEEMDAFLQTNQSEYYRLSPRSDRFLLFPAQDQFLSCHASTVLPLASGNVLVAYFAGDYEKADNVGIWLSRRISGAWERPARIAKVAEVAHWNPVLMGTDDEIRLVFKVGREIPSWKSFTMVSKDRGATWSEPVAYPAPNDACGPVRNKPLLTTAGWMLAPNSDETDTDWTVRIDMSLDGGAHYDNLAPIPLNLSRPQAANHISGKGAIQPTLWESEPGHIHALLRTTCGSIFRSDSLDGGRTWCEAYDTGLPNNNSGIDLAQLNNALYLVMNPVRGNWAGRTPIVVLKSTDNGATFAHFCTLSDELLNEADQRMAEFSYPAIVSRDGTLHITYTYLRRQIAYHEIRP